MVYAPCVSVCVCDCMRVDESMSDGVRKIRLSLLDCVIFSLHCRKINTLTNLNIAIFLTLKRKAN